MVFFKPLHLTLCQAATLLHIAGVMAADPAPAQPSGWPARPPINKIDTHHHIVPDFYAQAVTDAGGDPSGWPTPAWSANASETMMTQLGVKTAIFSVTAPGACILDGQPSYDLARRMNEYSASLRDAQPCKFGFFANLPNLLDTEATLNEIAYALDTLKADGVVLFTRYGDNNTYLGHPDLDPIWAELDRRRAVVFVHPTHPVDLNKVNPRLLQPLIDYPLETTRTAMDMITSGTRAKYSNCTIILSHAGGALPYLISRVIDPLKRTPDATAQANLGTTASQGWKDFQSFHYDLALSASPQVLNMALEIIPHDHLLYGSDFPYASAAAYPQFLEQLENFNMTAELRAKINYENGKALFPRLAKADGDCMPTTVDVVAKSC